MRARAQAVRSDQQLLRRAALVVAAQTGVAVAVVVAIVVVAVYAISQQARLDATERKVRDKVANASSYGVDLSVADPVVVDGLPAGCSEAQVRRAVAALPDGVSRIRACGDPFLAYVGTDDGVQVTAAVNFVEQQEETQRLAQLSVLVGLLGVLAAAVVGGLLARRAVRPLGDALTSQRRFVADASHELRTPVAILQTRAQMLARGPAHDPDQRVELGQLVHDARVLTDVVNDLLMVAEIQHRPPRRELVDLLDVADDVRASFAATADDAGVELNVVADRDHDHLVDGLSVALRRAVAALVDNAIKHSTPGGEVVLRVAAEPSNVTVAVLDDGTGLDGSRAANLTEPFRRGDDAPSDSHRLGLGLALVREICDAHHGTLHIDGRPGVGTEVALTIPEATSSPQTPRVRAAEVTETHTPGS